jgi:predicted Zn-dependent protease
MKSLSPQDDSNKIAYENYINFAESLMWMSKNDYETAKSKLTEILRNNPDNIIVLNNLSTLNLYINRVEKCYSDMKIILDKDQMNCFNDVTYHNISLLSDTFNLPKYP